MPQSIDDFLKSQKSGGSGLQSIDEFLSGAHNEPGKPQSIDDFLGEQERKRTAEIQASTQQTADLMRSGTLPFQSFQNSELFQQTKDIPVETGQKPIGLIRNTLQSWGEQAIEKGREKSESSPGRDIPVVGSILKGVDVVSSLPPLEALGEAGRSVYTPGAGLANMAGLYRGVQSGISKVAPGLAASRGGRIAQEALTEAAAGVPLTAGQSLAQTGELGESVKEGLLYGGLGGAGLGAAGRGIVEAAPTLKQAAGAISDRVGGLFNELASTQPKPLGISAFKTEKLQKTRIPDSPERVMDVIDVGGKPAKRDDGSAWERFYSSFVDEYAPLKRATKEIGGNVPTNENPFKEAWLSRGWKGKADTKLEYGFIDDTGNKSGNSLKEVLKPVQTRLDDLREYAVALRSLEYEKADLKSGISPQLSRKTIERFASDPEIQKAYNNLRQYMTDMNNDTLVNSGIWSVEKLMQMRREQPNYVPMFRVQEKGLRDGIQGASGKAFGNVKDPTKARTGSAKPIVDPIESIVKQTYKNQALAERNNVMRTLVELAEKNPDNTIVRKVQNTSAAEEIQKALDEFIMNPSGDMEKQLSQALDMLKPQTVAGKPNVFTVMRNGKAEQWEITDDAVAKVIAGLGNEPTNKFIDIVFGKPTSLLKAGLTLAPDFVLKNLIRDQMSAFVNSKYGFIPIWDTVIGLISAAKKDDAFYKWLGSGGANGAWVSLERDYLQGQIRNMTRSGIKRIQKNPVEYLRKLSEWSEQGTRLGEFKRGLKKGASLKDAALASRDVTLDFSRIGKNTKSINKMVAFFNVAVQSMDKMARQFVDRPIATPIKAAASITLPSVALYLWNHNKPEYQELPQWEKDTYWHFFIGDEVVKIPKPFEMGITFGTLPERALKYFYDNDPEGFKDYSKQLLEGFTPSIIPTIMVPWIEAYANKDTFTDAPIVPKREENLNKPDQYGPYTSEIAKGLGKLTDQSPRVLENTFTGLTGTLGRYGLQAADQALINNGLAEPPPPKPETGLAQKPLLRSFLSKGLEGSSQSMDAFYKEKERLTKDRNSAKKNGERYAEALKYDRYNKISERISDEQANIRKVLDSRDMTPEEKRQRIQEINMRITNLARKARGLPTIER